MSFKTDYRNFTDWNANKRKKKKKEQGEQNIQELRNNCNRCNIHIIVISEEEGRKNRVEKIFEVTIAMLMVTT